MLRLMHGGLVATAARALRQRPQQWAPLVMPLLDAVRRASSTSGTGFPRGLNTENPFEIKFHVEHVDGLPEDALEENAGIESCFFEDEIQKFHSEMIGVFGSEPEEHDDSGQQNHPAAHAATSTQANHAQSPLYAQQPATVLNPLENNGVRARTPAAIRPPRLVRCGQPCVRLIQGPCTYVHESWVGSKESWSTSDIESIVDDIAEAHGVRVQQHHSNHEGQVLDWLLTTAADDKIILNWNGRLVDSPTIFHALSSIRAFVVILAPLNLELGPLPPSVKGVISGFGTKSLELAIQACK